MTLTMEDARHNSKSAEIASAVAAERERCAQTAEQEVEHLADQCTNLLRENERLRAALDPFARHAHCVNEIQPSSLALWCAQALNALSE